ncbi:MAG: hypothetical protein A3E84_03130 [Gammaproteobacteria bacterium RIFCSPHIGHO2_12_FULL_42_13]|nr:MAG: hypothetical protein A3E84_03130 [Gammaproteobacteria bacterium RIFCSPHIGHO2_12_FULL_42_13]
MGGPIPERYLLEIKKLAEVAKRSGFEINLWVDNERRNYVQPLVLAELSIPHLQIRNISELYENMDHEAFYQGDEGRRRKIKLQTNIGREMEGFKNLAAASDLLRLEILRQFGGYYFDTDTRFYVTPTSIMVPDHAAAGFVIHAGLHWSRVWDGLLA